MTRYGNIARIPVPQTEPARADQVKNNAGGFVFELDRWKQLDRFLILGQEGNTYYASERKVVKQNTANLERLLLEDGARVVNRIVEISDTGRAPKNDPAIFALATAAASSNDTTRAAALAALPKVCRIGTHLFHFAADVNASRGWGRGLRNAVGNWYLNRSVDALAHQAIKYQQRDGWSHRDLLRLSHPQPKSKEQAATFKWMTAGIEGVREIGADGALPTQIQAFVELQSNVKSWPVCRAVQHIVKHKLPRECIPTELLNKPEIWEALLEDMGPTALIRNLGKLSSLGMTKPMSATTKKVVSKLTDREVLKKARVHPMAALLAAGVYRQGRGVKGSLSWTPEAAILDALDETFYAGFEHVEPTNKNTMVCLDVSGSMWGGVIAGAPGIHPANAALAMAMVTVRAENAASTHVMGFSNTFRALGITKKDTIVEANKKVSGLPFASTDCSLPMQYAMKNKLEVDVFQVYTDNETYAGNVHPFVALKQYRQKLGRDAKLVVVGLTATNFTIADPSDAGMLDVVGMDTHAPALMADFARGGL